MLNTSDLEPGARVCPRSLPRALCICTVGEDRAARGSGPSYMWRIIGQRIAGARGVAAGGAVQPYLRLLFLLVTRENAKKKFVPCFFFQGTGACGESQPLAGSHSRGAARVGMQAQRVKPHVEVRYLVRARAARRCSVCESVLARRAGAQSSDSRRGAGRLIRL